MREEPFQFALQESVRLITAQSISPLQITGQVRQNVDLAVCYAAYLCIVPSVLADFRTQIVWGADTSLCQLHCAAQHFGDAKVTQLQQPSSRHEDVLRLDVPFTSRVHGHETSCACGEDIQLVIVGVH